MPLHSHSTSLYHALLLKVHLDDCESPFKELSTLWLVCFIATLVKCCCCCCCCFCWCCYHGHCLCLGHRPGTKLCCFSLALMTLSDSTAYLLCRASCLVPAPVDMTGSAVSPVTVPIPVLATSTCLPLRSPSLFLRQAVLPLSTPERVSVACA